MTTFLSACEEHGVCHAVCQRCSASDHDGAVIVCNLTTFWNGGIGGREHPTLCVDCVEDIRQFANATVERGATTGTRVIGASGFRWAT